MFIGRESEINVLNEYILRPGNQVMVMYGQKGVGKSTLIHKFIQDMDRTIYFATSSLYEREQLSQWGRQSQKDNANISEYPTYEDIFAAILSQYQDNRADKIVLIFDEFQFLLKHSNHFTEALFQFLESTELNFFVILCSSSIEWIENSMIKKIGIKAKNITGFFKVKELGFSDFTKYFDSFSFEECITGYSIFGGIPEIWELVDKNISLEENIVNGILNKNNYLYHYGEEIVSRELRETSIYNTILCTLADGKNKLNDLYSHTQFSRAKISVYIKNLMELGIVEKEFSLDTDGRNNTQKAMYDICNHYVYFTYQFLFPYKYELEFGNRKEFYNQRIKPYLRQYGAKYFSIICKEYFETQNQLMKLPIQYTKIGKWIGKTGTIDLVAQDEAQHTILALCNWEKPMMRYDDYEWLIFCAKQAKLKPDYVYLFSAGGFDEKLKFAENSKKNVKLLTLEDL